MEPVVRAVRDGELFGHQVVVAARRHADVVAAARTPEHGRLRLAVVLDAHAVAVGQDRPVAVVGVALAARAPDRLGAAVPERHAPLLRHRPPVRRDGLREHAGAREALDLARDRVPRELDVVVVGVDPRVVGELGVGVEAEAEPVLGGLELVAPRVGHVPERELRAARAVVEVVAVEHVELRLEAVLLVRLLEGGEERVAPAGLQFLAGEGAEHEDHVVDVERRAVALDVARAPHLGVGDGRPELLRRLERAHLRGLALGRLRPHVLDLVAAHALRRAAGQRGGRAADSIRNELSSIHAGTPS